MSIRIVTGKLGIPHVTSYQMQAFNRGLLGDFALIGKNNKMSATKINNNLVRIADGCVVMQGIYAIIPYDDHVDVPIENVEIGYRRIDTIYLHYQKSTETDLEQVTIDVAKGVTVRENPVHPSIPTGDRWEGDNDIRIPMYDIGVTVDGITIIPYERMTKDYPNIYELEGGGSTGVTWNTLQDFEMKNYTVIEEG